MFVETTSRPLDFKGSPTYAEIIIIQ